MSISNRLSINLTHIRLHSVSSVWIPHSVNDFKSFISFVRLRSLYLYSNSRINLHGLSNFNILRNNLLIRLSPIKFPILQKYSNPFKTPEMYPNASKRNAKRCNCCVHLCTKSTISSSVSGRTFSVINNSERD